MRFIILLSIFSLSIYSVELPSNVESRLNKYLEYVTNIQSDINVEVEGIQSKADSEKAEIQSKADEKISEVQSKLSSRIDKEKEDIITYLEREKTRATKDGDLELAILIRDTILNVKGDVVEDSSIQLSIIEGMDTIRRSSAIRIAQMINKGDVSYYDKLEGVEYEVKATDGRNLGLKIDKGDIILIVPNPEDRWVMDTQLLDDKSNGFDWKGNNSNDECYMYYMLIDNENNLLDSKRIVDCPIIQSKVGCTLYLRPNEFGNEINDDGYGNNGGSIKVKIYKVK